MNKTTSVMSSEQGLMVKGDLVFATVSSVREKSYGILENYHKNEFVVDCSDMSRIDSAGTVSYTHLTLPTIYSV